MFWLKICDRLRPSEQADGHSEISRAFNSCVQAIEIDKCKKIFYGCHNRNIHLKKALNETHATSKARFSQEASKASLSISDQSAGVPNYSHVCEARW